MVVDDCPDTVASFGELLVLYGHDVRTARAGSGRLALIDVWQPGRCGFWTSRCPK